MARIHDRRVWPAGGALVGVLMLALSWFTLVGPQLASARALRDETAATQQQNDKMAVNAASLEAKSKHVATYASSLRTAVDGLPYTSGLPAFTRQVNAQATAHHVTLSSVSVGGVTPLATTGSTTGSGETTSSAGGLFSVQVTLLSTGSLKAQLAFLDDVRTRGPRSALVTSTQIAPGEGSENDSVDAKSSLTTQVTIFVAPRSPEQVAQLKRLLAGDLDG